MSPRASGVEVELKLLVPRAVAARLLRHPLLRRGAGPVRSRLYTIYYDTPALDLQRHDMTLRVRREGRRWIQAVKGGGQVRGGLHRRAESEVEIRGPKPDIAALGDRAAGGVLALAEVRSRLQPLFSTDFVRIRRLLRPQPGVRVEASLDQGVIRSGPRRAELSELELELKAGAPQHLYDLATALSREIPLAICDRSKAARGYALALDRDDTPAKSQPPALSREMSVHDAFRAVLWAGLSHLQANEAGLAVGRDIEYLHQARVAVRRLRSAIALFAPLYPPGMVEPARADLKWLASRLGPARDWDVFMTETLPAIGIKAGRAGALEDFEAQCGRLRRAAHRRARRALRSGRYRRFALSLAAWLSREDWRAGLDRRAVASLEEPAIEYAASVLDKRYRRVKKRGRDLEELSSGALHRLRIAIKKLRYAADFFSSLYEAAAVRASLKRLARLQDILGAINDAATAPRLAAEAGGAAARRCVLRWRRERTAALRSEAKRAWREFRATEKFW